LVRRGGGQPPTQARQRDVPPRNRSTDADAAATIRPMLMLCPPHPPRNNARLSPGPRQWTRRPTPGGPPGGGPPGGRRGPQFDVLALEGPLAPATSCKLTGATTGQETEYTTLHAYQKETKATATGAQLAQLNIRARSIMAGGEALPPAVRHPQLDRQDAGREAQGIR
jgi:hypothetical protein